MAQVDPRWRKASYSGEGANCVEAGNLPGAVLVRDSKDRSGPTLMFPADAWRGFLSALPPGRTD